MKIRCFRRLGCEKRALIVNRALGRHCCGGCEESGSGVGRLEGALARGRAERRKDDKSCRRCEVPSKGTGGESCNRILSQLTRYPPAEDRSAGCRKLREQGKDQNRQRLMLVSTWGS